MRAVAIDFDAVLGDTRPLWEAWLAETARRLRLDLALPRDRGEAAVLLDHALGAWTPLLQRFAEEHAPVYLRPRAPVNAALRGLRSAGVTIGAFTDAPASLARVASAHLGTERLIDLLETGAGAEERLLERLGEGTALLRSVAQLLAAGKEGDA
jgi:phosphoglycolate phosphatase-like HAD superfamily hydrolase